MPALGRFRSDDYGIATVDLMHENRDYRMLAAVAVVDQVRLAIVVDNCLAGLPQRPGLSRMLGHIDLLQSTRSRDGLRRIRRATAISRENPNEPHAITAGSAEHRASARRLPLGPSGDDAVDLSRDCATPIVLKRRVAHAKQSRRRLRHAALCPGLNRSENRGSRNKRPTRQRTACTGAVKTYPAPRSVRMSWGRAASGSSFFRRRPTCTSIARSYTSSSCRREKLSS
jgi:hypothetical protein